MGASQGSAPALIFKDIKPISSISRPSFSKNEPCKTECLDSGSRQRLNGRAVADSSDIGESVKLGVSRGTCYTVRRWRLLHRSVVHRPSAAAPASPPSSSSVNGGFGTAVSVFGHRRRPHRRRISLRPSVAASASSAPSLAIVGRFVGVASVSSAVRGSSPYRRGHRPLPIALRRRSLRRLHRYSNR